MKFFIKDFFCKCDQIRRKTPFFVQCQGFGLFMLINPKARIKADKLNGIDKRKERNSALNDGNK